MTMVMRPPSPHPPPWPLCLHSLRYDVIPYWGQIVPSTIPIEARVQGSDKNGFLHPSFKLSGFCYIIARNIKIKTALSI